MVVDENKEKEGRKGHLYRLGRSAKSAVPFYREEIGFRVERALENLGSIQELYGLGLGQEC